MQAVILAAGTGTRMRPLSKGVPKPVLPVAGRPLLTRVADAAVAGGADELVVVVDYRADAVRTTLGDEHDGVPVRYVTQGETPGTAAAVAAARPHIDGPFVVLNGDCLYDPAGVARLFESGPALGVASVENPTEYGVVRVTDGSVEDIVEKPADPPTSLANAGAYRFPAEAVDLLDVPQSDRGERELTDVLARLIDARSVTPVRFDDWHDVGRPWELLAANEAALASLDRRVAGDVDPSADLRGDVVVEAGATVDAGTVVEGPTVIQSGATVGPNAYVRGASVVGPNVSVGHAVEIKNSLLMRGTSVSHLSYVGDSVVGRDVNFGAGTQVANLRHDDDHVRATVKDERVSTGRRKFGVVVGHRTKTGINTSLNPGISLSVESRTAPGAVVTNDR